MAITDLGLLGSGSDTVAGTTLAVTNSTGAIIPAGTLLVLAIALDNPASVSQPSCVPSSVSSGNPWTQRGVNQNGVTTTAGSGLWGFVNTVKTVSDIAIGATITTITHTSLVCRSAVIQGYAGADNTLRNTFTAAGSSTGVPSVTSTGTALVAGDLVVGVVCGENNAAATADADTLNGSWTSISSAIANTGTALTSMSVGLQGKIVNATGAQTYNPTTANHSIAFIWAMLPAGAPTQIAAARRRGGVRAVRRRPAEVPLPQTAVTPPQYTAPMPRRGFKGLAPRRRTSAEVPTHLHGRPPAAAPRRRVSLPVLRRRGRVEVVPPQIVVTPPTLAPDTRRRAARILPTRRRRPAEVTPAQIVVTPPQYTPPVPRRGFKGLAPRRRTSAEVPTHLHGKPPAAAPRRRGSTPALRRRSRRPEVVPPQIAAAPAPPYVPNPARRGVKGMLRRMVRQAVVVFAPSGAVAPLPPDVTVVAAVLTRTPVAATLPRTIAANTTPTTQAAAQLPTTQNAATLPRVVKET